MVPKKQGEGGPDPQGYRGRATNPVEEVLPEEKTRI